jgi:DNA-binding response OmpR family regulator
MEETRVYQILLVDNRHRDDRLIQRLRSEPLEKQFQVCRVTTNEAAIQMVQDKHWDSVLIHQKIGNLQALELVHHIRLWNQHVLLLLVTDCYDNQMEYKVRKAGAADYFIDESLTQSILSALVENSQNDEKPGQGAGIFLHLDKILSLFIKIFNSRKSSRQSFNQAA